MDTATTKPSASGPVQMGSKRPQRAIGEGRLNAKKTGARTAIDRLRQQGCCKLRVPTQHTANAPLEAVMINTSGGMTGGDDLAWSFQSGPACSLTVTTQACERVYRSSGGVARSRVDMTLQEGASLCWLPQETILFDGASFARTLTVDMAPTARLLMVEPIVFGREAMGETVHRLHFKDVWKISKDGHPIHQERMSLNQIPGPKAALNPLVAPHGMDNKRAMATVLYIAADAEDHLPAVRVRLGGTAAASAWNEKLIVRLVSADAYSLRKTLIPVLELLSTHATMTPTAMPKVWSS
ncbi:MAG: urease accessory protein UreD [Pseudomonadota bacterium]